MKTRTPGRGWAYSGAILGGAVSIAANIAHSYVPPKDAPAHWSPHVGAVVGAVFWPVALFVAVEIFARIAWPTGGRWTALRFVGLLPVALVAAVVSYRHLSGLLGFYGEDGLTVVIGPLAVDGLMVMATGALIAIGARQLIVEAVAVEVVEQAPASAETPEPVTPYGTPRRRPAKRAPSAERVAKVYAKHPDATHEEIAKKAGVSVRTVARHRPALAEVTA